MLLKLVMPYHDRTFQGGTIVRWFKGEGDWINYGDDLFDLRLGEVRVTKTITASRPHEWLREMAEHVPGFLTPGTSVPATESSMEGSAANEPAEFFSWDAVVVLRIRSSDVGCLRRIEAKEGEYRDIGERLGLVTTDEAESSRGCLPTGGRCRRVPGRGEYDSRRVRGR